MTSMKEPDRGLKRPTANVKSIKRMQMELYITNCVSAFMCPQICLLWSCNKDVEMVWLGGKVVVPSLSGKPEQEEQNPYYQVQHRQKKGRK